MEYILHIELYQSKTDLNRCKMTKQLFFPMFSYDGVMWYSGLPLLPIFGFETEVAATEFYQHNKLQTADISPTFQTIVSIQFKN